VTGDAAEKKKRHGFHGFPSATSLCSADNQKKRKEFWLQPQKIFARCEEI